MSVPSQGIIKRGEEKIGDHLETVSNFSNFLKALGTSLAVQWLRFHLAMHGVGI